ncbi:VOC family protein [Glycomyces tritici]|uniref:VOC family protein n=1 Tax=Glycomyces tritici TaxID=2665176 RepID=A0ABT7YXI4_9ACTN|nr:VOC family protein [Glycomyces tritici]MDN3243064.1 VOC family protein [Glycomyces tritici]
MTEYISPVPMPSPTAVAPEIYKGVYGMPMFASIPTSDFEASKRFWTEGLGFIDFFTTPGQMTHLRRWAFQDVLLLPGEPTAQTPGMTVTFTCVLSQFDEIKERCEAILPGCTEGPIDRPWNTVDLIVTTPENVKVVMTSGKPLDLNGPVADYLRESGWDLPTE